MNANNDTSDVVINNLSDIIFDEESQTKQKKTEKLGIENKLEICCASSFLCFVVIMTFCIAIGYIVWLGFAIKAISNTSNKDIKNKCSESDIWPLMLVIIIVSGASILTSLNRNGKNKEEDEESSMNDIVSTVFKFCFQLALLIWTGFELNANCAKNNLDDENIYILLHYWFYFGCVSIIIMILLASLRGCLKIF